MLLGCTIVFTLTELMNNSKLFNMRRDSTFYVFKAIHTFYAAI